MTALESGHGPTALKIRKGAETRAPAAIAVIGGPVTATLLTPVVPVVQMTIDAVEDGFKKNLLSN